MDRKITPCMAFTMAGVVVILCLVAILLPPSEEQINITERAEEQVSIQEEEELEMIGKYECGFINRYKLHDNRDNVTCWLYRGGHGGGMSCIPDHMLTP